MHDIRFGSLALLLGSFAVACGGSSQDPLEDADAEITRTQAQLVLSYDQARKTELIDGHFFAASDFTGTAIVVKTARTKIDIAYLLPESDTTAPNELCYKGGVTGVKKILNAMLANTDGNGDHWLGEDTSIESGSGGKLVVSWTTIGEGGEEPHELDVPRCP